jgi:hypothetical protein
MVPFKRVQLFVIIIFYIVLERGRGEGGGGGGRGRRKWQQGGILQRNTPNHLSYHRSSVRPPNSSVL